MDTSNEFKGKYLNYDSTKDGDIAELLSGGEIVEMKGFDGKMKKTRNIPVKLNGDVEMIWTPWDKDGRKLQEAFGKESDNWKGKKISILHEDKKMMIRPITIEIPKDLQ